MSAPTPTPPIAIIGAGPCGLTLARLLSQKGIDYALYERDPRDAPGRAGGSLDIHAGTGQRAIREAGLWEEFRQRARWEDEVFRVYGPDGAFKLDLGDGGDKRDAPEIDRAALRDILLASVPEGRVRWGEALAGVEKGEGGPVLRFADGRTESGFGLVVGADGAWSRVRPMLTDAKPAYSGKTFIEARISLTNPLHATAARNLGPGTVAALGPLQQLVFQRQGDGAYRMYLAAVLPETFARDAVDLSDTEGARRLFLGDAFFGGWAEEWKEYIRHAEAFRAWPLYSMAAGAMRWESVPGFAVVGDAAHVAIPAGEGVNAAMTDALELANKIAEHGVENLDRAVREYEEEMFPRAVKLVNLSQAVAGWMWHENNPDEFVRAVKEGDLFRAADIGVNPAKDKKN
ncbi:hypothetical protein F4810DRAFT_208540 [Camillea tinctor]|nr:hypothetical protein F4810DRAFT_208540 [Camillea tinctor]